MKDIVLKVPESFKLDPWWESAPSDVIVEALRFVPELVRSSSVAPDVLKRMKELEIQLLGSRETAVHAANAACEQVTKAFEARASEKERMCQMLQDENKTYKHLIEQLNHDNRIREERHSNEIAQITKNTTQSTMISAQQAGSIAESDVESVIADCLICEIDDVSKIEGQGDRFITTPSGLKLLQETKAVERLHSKKDIEKFKRDVHDGITNSRINAAILISLKSQTIPNHGPGACSIYFNNGPCGRVPVVMLASNNRNTIQMAVQTIAWLQDLAHKEFSARGNAVTTESEQLEKERQFLQEHLPKFIESIQQSESEVDARIDMLKTLMDAAEQERAKQSDVRFLILKLQQNIPWLITKTDSALMLAENILRSYHNQKGEYPKSSQLTLSQRTAIKNAGGIKVVLDRMKRKHDQMDDEAVVDDGE